MRKFSLSPRNLVQIRNCLIVTLLALAVSLTAKNIDSRNFANGNLIPAENYCDQPRIVVTRDGTWVCVLTTGPGREGEAGEHIVATSSIDQGKTWTRLVDVEPVDKDKRSAYAIALLTPADRIYAFYCYNGDAISTLPDGKPIRDDMQGWFCYRYSDDKGKTWSDRYRLPMRLTAVDRGNDWKGKLQMFWAIGTPTVANDTVMFGFTKLGKYILKEGEGWFYRSDNVLKERDPQKIIWELLPDGDHGVRSPQFGSVQEEFDVVHLEKESFFSVNRTTLGHAACAYTRDGGHTWSVPDALRYSPGGRVVKQPRACTKIWKTRDGHYLLWFHNNGTTSYSSGPFVGSRNIAWLASGELKEGMLSWSQPEIVAYVEGGLEGCSYPDLVEDHERYYICATQKTQARVMEVENELLTGLWGQANNHQITSNGLVLNLIGKACASGTTARAPRLKPLGGDLQHPELHRGDAGGMTLDASLKFTDLAADQVILDSRDSAGRGYFLETIDHQSVRFGMCDGWQSAYWDSDAGLLQTNRTHEIAVTVDGAARVIAFVIDGVVCDGASQRMFGYGRFDPNFKDITGARLLKLAPNLHGGLDHVRIYDRALRNSELVGNARAGKNASNSRSSDEVTPHPQAESLSKHLLLDSRVVDETNNMHLTFGHVEKDPRNPLFRADKPWENALNNFYPNLVYEADAGLFRLWYKDMLPDKEVIDKMMPPRVVLKTGWFLLYATSRDGLHWEKPNLGLWGFNGSTSNNVVMRDDPNTGVFKDVYDQDPARRYKMIYDVGRGQLRVRFSRDGLHWTGEVIPAIKGGVGDTHNNAFFDPRSGKYVLITRLMAGERKVARSESLDFTNWSDAKVVLESLPSEKGLRQTYCMPSFPYAHIFLGFLMLINTGTDKGVDCELTWSPDTVTWYRVNPGHSLIPRGPKGSYDAGCIYAPAGGPVLRDGKIMILYGGSEAVHVGTKRHCLPCWAYLRPDGFAGYEPIDPAQSGTVITKPMRYTGEALRVSADAAGGEVLVTALDQDGAELARAMPIKSNVTDEELRWEPPGRLSKETVVRLKFELRAAKLFSFSGLALEIRN